MTCFRWLAVALFGVLAACVPTTDLPSRQGEVYVVAPFQVLPENALFCRVDANNVVRPCVVFKGDFPSGGLSREAIVGLMGLRVLRSASAPQGRFAFAQATTRSSVSRTSYRPGEATLVVEPAPNTILFMDIGLPAEQSRELARAAVAEVFGPEAADLPVRFANGYEIERLEGGGFRLLSVLKPVAR